MKMGRCLDVAVQCLFCDFMNWCESSFLNINVAKTKELCIDLHLSSPLF